MQPWFGLLAKPPAADTTQLSTRNNLRDGIVAKQISHKVHKHYWQCYDKEMVALSVSVTVHM